MADFGIKPDLALQLKSPPSISLGDMVNIARGVQAYQQAEQANPLLLQQAQQATRTGEINLGVAEQQNAERMNLQRFFSDPENFQTNGRIDLNKVNKVVPQIAPLTGREIMKNVADLATAQSGADTAIRALTQDAREKIASRLSIMGRLGISDPRIIGKELDNLVIEFGNDKNIENATNWYKYVLSRSGDTISPNDLLKEAQSVLTVGQQEEKFAPKAAAEDVGGQLREKITTPSVAGLAPKVEIGRTLAQKTLSPQTEIVVGEGNQFGLAPGTKTFIGGMGPATTGVRPEQMGQPKAKQAATPAISSLSLLESSTLAADAKLAAEDYTNISQIAQTSQQQIQNLRQIKASAPKGFTGAVGERQAVAASVLNTLGIPAYEKEKVETDLLNKNGKLLAMAGGNTDMARAMAEAANPNAKMEAKSIEKVANYMIGGSLMNNAKLDFLDPYKNNARQYVSKMKEIKDVLNPNLFYFESLNDQEARKFLDEMPSEEKKQFRKQLEKATKIGIIK